MLHPSLPPRPSFPKSPSPQENTKPNKHQTVGQTMITVFPRARKLLEKDILTFICQSKSLSISASTSNLNYSVSKEHFNLQKRERDVSNTLIMFLKLHKHFQAVTLDVQVIKSCSLKIQHCSVTAVCQNRCMTCKFKTVFQNSTSCSECKRDCIFSALLKYLAHQR